MLVSHSVIAHIFHSGLVRGVARAPDIAEEDINVMFETNVTGLINVTQAILPIFLKRPNGGQGDIVNIGSIAGKLCQQATCGT
jgi:3-hydroxy acid dehydrogenase/malonic semialdehyde reductase